MGSICIDFVAKIYLLSCDLSVSWSNYLYQNITMLGENDFLFCDRLEVKLSSIYF